MDIDAKVLHILFRRIPPELILQRMRHPLTPSVTSEEGSRLLLRYADTELGRYSQDEQKMIFQRVLDSTDAFLKTEQMYRLSGIGASLPRMAFLSLIRFSTRILTVQAGEPLCKIHEAGLWRRVYLALGQDLPVCAYLAYADFCRQQNRQDFTWPAIVRTDHKALNAQLRQGLAENHFHLYGSTQTFPLAWCNLMNYPRDLEAADWKQFDQFLQPAFVRGPEDCLFSSKERVRYAAFFRSNLFCTLHAELRKEAKIFRAFHPEILARDRIQMLLYLYGAKIPQINGRMEQLDYALEEPFFRAAPDSPYRCLAGERSFLYRCFRALMRNELKDEGEHLFYLYVLLKLQFRSEMIQVNQQMGFQNFQDYQNRKGSLICRDSYWTEAIRMGINAPMQTGDVTSLEARLTPKARAMEYLNTIRDIDGKKHFSDQPVFPDSAQGFPPKRYQCMEYEPQEAAKLPYFYVIHFIKELDKPPKSVLAMECRHQRLRHTVRKQAVALAKAMSNFPGLCGRVRGIDSSSNEIGCPPEVFATAFRFLRDFHPQEYFQASPFRTASIPKLSATYHVGEDFLELASGLRAIDESVAYLELRRDDRLGHALGLGAVPEDYYAQKGRRLSIRKQERLDDLVWLLYRGRELGVEMDPDLRSQLAKEAETLLLDIYGCCGITLLQYHCSMQLRGDDPSLYITKKYQRPPVLSDHYDMFKYSRRSPELESYRTTRTLAFLYYRYHYGYQEKLRGNQIQEVAITPKYIHLMHQVQDRLQAYLARENIVIECNPSSNVLIGTFGEYRRHPVFRFYSGGLCGDKNKEQMQVCINTDDLGVFDTSLAFEYALLFQTLEEETGSDGAKKYQVTDELRYLKELQNMSRMAVFPSAAAQTEVRRPEDSRDESHIYKRRWNDRWETLSKN